MDYGDRLLRLLREVEYVKGLAKPNHDVYDDERRARVQIYDTIPYQPGRNEHDPGLLMIGYRNGRVSQAPAIKGLTAPNEGAFVALWRASALYDYGELYTYAGVSIYTPTRPDVGGAELITEHDEYIAPQRANLNRYRPETMPTNIRALLRRGLFIAWLNDGYGQPHRGDREPRTNVLTLPNGPFVEVLR